jgi:protein phosphatase
MNYQYRADCLTDIGKKRTSNQDVILEAPEYGFYAVSDGMGGLVHGGETSAMIKERLPLRIARIFAEAKERLTPENATAALTEQVCLLNEEIFSLGRADNVRDFGATLTGVWFIGRHAVFINIGDSRGYIFREGGLRQITKDHTLAAYLVASGELTPEEAFGHSSNNRLMRYMGMNPPAKPETFIEEISPGCGILLCSDGLYGMITDEEIARILQEHGKAPAQALIDAANARGGKDNISAAYIAVEATEA